MGFREWVQEGRKQKSHEDTAEGNRRTEQDKAAASGEMPGMRHVIGTPL